MTYLTLTWLMLNHGHLGHSGEDFNHHRAEELKGLEDFIPVAAKNDHTNSPRTNSIIRNVIAQSSFFKNSFKPQRGHLNVNALNYIRIPKSASTSMSKEMLEKKYAALKQRAVTDKQTNFLADVNLEVEITRGAVFFTVVRNPFARLVSVYRDFFENPEHYIYRDYLFGILPQQLTFSEFVDRIAKIPDRLKDQHIKPQHIFLTFYEQNGIDVKVFKVEEPEGLTQFLNGYEMNLRHLNKSGSYDYRSYYSNDTLKKTVDLYRADIDRFGYENEVKKLAEFIQKGLGTVH